MKIEPEGVMLLLKPDTVEEMTAGKLIVPGIVKDRKKLEMVTGEIITLGPAVQIEFGGEDVKEGNHILFARYAGYLMEDSETQVGYRLVDHKDILARIS